MGERARVKRAGRPGPLRLGLIGMSEGNGHPYSWPAIFNGYDAREMASCPFEAIPRYLGQRRFPKDAIAGAAVTHVWTQSPKLSAHIARSARVPNVARRMEDLVGAVDAVLLARDDAENHYRMSEPFLEAGMPVYVDKPLATDRRSVKRIFGLARRRGAKLFTCSALAYAPEFVLNAAERKRIGRLAYIDASAPKSWAKYSAHVIEPALRLAGEQGRVRRSRASGRGAARSLDVEWQSGLRGTFRTTGTADASFVIRVFGDKGSREMVFKDFFTAFKGALRDFVDVARGRSEAPSEKFVSNVVDLIERGME